MIVNLFEALTNAVNSTPLIAISASFLWGILSIVLSPCHLASIPLIIGFINDQGDITTKKAFWLSTVFSTGILITIALMGIVTAFMGRMLGDIGLWGNYFAGAVFLIVGLLLFDIITIPSFVSAEKSFIREKGILSSLLLGLIFGIALGPCTFAYMAPMLAITFSLAAQQILYGILLIAVYGIGHCSVIILAGTFTEAVQHYLNWNEKSKGTLILKRICGIFIFAAGIYMFFQK